jgi:hypothetical protein
VKRLRAKGRWINVELSERQARKKGKNQRIQIQQGVPGERVCKRKKNGGEI